MGYKLHFGYHVLAPDNMYKQIRRQNFTSRDITEFAPFDDLPILMTLIPVNYPGLRYGLQSPVIVMYVSFWMHLVWTWYGYNMIMLHSILTDSTFRKTCFISENIEIWNFLLLWELKSDRVFLGNFLWN